MLKGKKIFITGGAGFIGSSVAARLLDENRVVVYDSFARNTLQNFRIREHENVSVYEGDIQDFERLNAAMAEARPSHLVHCAAITGIDTVIKSPVTTLEVNVLGTVNTLRAARNIGSLERVITFSTGEVFGRQSYLNGEQSEAVIGAVGEARWSYAASKLACEHLSIAYYKEFAMPVVVLRPFNVYGPGQVGEGALAIFIQRAIKNEGIEIRGDGTQIRAWCYIDDMVDAVLTALEHPAAVGESFNVGNPRAVTTIYGLANAVIRILKSSSPIAFTGKDHADIELRVPDVGKARRVLGFEAKVDLEAGIPSTAEYYRARNAVR